MVKTDRKLVPIVSLDVVGYGRLVQRNERQMLRLVRRVYEVLVHPTIEAAGGKVFKTMGDGLLAEFSSVVAAVEWTADLQRTLHERQIKAPGGEIFQVRAGIVLADVLVAGRRSLRRRRQLRGARPDASRRRAAWRSPSGCTSTSRAGST